MGNRQRKGGERREGGPSESWKEGKLERSRPRCFLMTSGNFILAKMRT